MKIVFVAVDALPFYAKSLDERPLGGSTTAVIGLAEALQSLGHEVIVVTNYQNPPPSLPVYMSIDQFYRIKECDVLIIVRGWRRIFFLPPIEYKKRFLWTGDSYDKHITIGMGDKRVSNIYDGLFLKSHWHADSFSQVSGYPRDKIKILRNGVDLNYFEGKEIRLRKRLIYSSLPHRGLIYLPNIFLELKEKHSDLELHIFGNSGRSSEEWTPDHQIPDIHFEKLLEVLRGIPGVFVHGSILQKKLAREFMKSSILAYPCNYEETCCSTALEAQAAGCAIVTSNLGSLPEAVGNAGILIKEAPGSELYFRKYIEAIDKVLTDEDLFQRLSSAGLQRAKYFDWKLTAENLLYYLKD